MIKRSWPIFLIFISMISVQASASMAKYLFPLLGPAAMTAWRLFFSAVYWHLFLNPGVNLLPNRLLSILFCMALPWGV